MTNLTEQKYKQRIGKIIFTPQYDENFTEFNRIRSVKFYLSDWGVCDFGDNTTIPEDKKYN